VVVEFIEGDPDRPLITGRVYNAEQKPPYELPGVLDDFMPITCAPPGGGGHNEISIDDTKGKEKMTLHSQYDMSTTVQHDETHTVNNTFTETIKSNTSITVTEGTYDFAVLASRATYHVVGPVKEDFDATLTTTVKSSINVKSASDEIVIDGATKITLQSGASKIELYADGRINIVGKNLTITGDTDAKLSSPKVAISGGDQAQIGCGNQATTYDKAQTTHSGAAITSAAVGKHEITGAVVKIN
jgi:type VI secretion system secreted protein VgrG